MLGFEAFCSVSELKHFISFYNRFEKSTFGLAQIFLRYSNKRGIQLTVYDLA